LRAPWAAKRGCHRISQKAYYIRSMAGDNEPLRACNSHRTVICLNMRYTGPET
jgi:hypothetical protein